EARLRREMENVSDGLEEGIVHERRKGSCPDLEPLRTSGERSSESRYRSVKPVAGFVVGRRADQGDQLAGAVGAKPFREDRSADESGSAGDQKDGPGHSCRSRPTSRALRGSARFVRAAARGSTASARWPAPISSNSLRRRTLSS